MTAKSADKSKAPSRTGKGRGKKTGKNKSKKAGKGTARKAPAKGNARGETGMSNEARVAKMIPILEESYPDARCQLHFSSPFELLIATILAAQCTDAMVNRVTPGLFKKYPTPQAFVDAPAEAIEKAIFKTGFYRNKTKSIKKCCESLVDEHAGNVPDKMDELLKLGGVGRKTANCVLGNAYSVPGIVVDTHVKRILPKDHWTQFSHLIGDHGRNVCTARKPACDECPVEQLCPKILD